MKSLGLAKKDLRSFIALFLVIFFNFSCFVSAFSFTTASIEDVESHAISNCLSKKRLKFVFMTSRAPSYPNYDNRLGSEINFDLNHRYGTTQLTVAAALPTDDLRPVQIPCLGQTPIAFVSLPSYDSANSENIIGLIGSSLFSTKKRGDELGESEVYITRTMANKLLKKDSPSLEEYRSLLGAKLDSVVVNQSTVSSFEFSIIDIVELDSGGWVQGLCDGFVIFSGYQTSYSPICDGFSLLTVIQGDFYSNQRFLTFFHKKVNNEFRYISHYFFASDFEENFLPIVKESVQVYKNIINLRIVSAPLTILFLLAYIFVPILFGRPNKLAFVELLNDNWIITITLALFSYSCSLIFLYGLRKFLGVFTPFFPLTSFGVVIAIFINLLSLFLFFFILKKARNSRNTKIFTLDRGRK